MKERELSEKIIINQRKEERKIEFENKKAKLRAMFRDEKFTESEYAEDVKRLDIEYSDINKNIEQVDWYARLMEIVDITDRIATVLKSDNIESKRKMLSLLSSNLIWNDKTLLIINTKEVEALIKGAQRVKSLYPEFEPKNYIVDKGLNEKTGSFSPAFSTLLRTWEDVRLAIIEENQ